MSGVVSVWTFGGRGRRLSPERSASVCAHPSRPGRRFLPFEYTAKVKRPTEHYLLHGVIGYDLIVTALAYAPLSARPVWLVACLAIYIAAFFATYEIGYFENDRVAAARETTPTQSLSFADESSRFSPVAGWIWGLTLGAAGAALQSFIQINGPLVPADPSLPVAFTANWGLITTLQVVTRLAFYGFNHSDPASRLTAMLVMQLARVLGYALLFSISLVGAALCVSHALARWAAYAAYRAGGDRRRLQLHHMTFLIFVGIAMAILITDAPALVGHAAQALLIILYLAARALRDLARRVD